jgi:hypothetical protein
MRFDGRDRTRPHRAIHKSGAVLLPARKWRLVPCALFVSVARVTYRFLLLQQLEPRIAARLLARVIVN